MTASLQLFAHNPVHQERTKHVEIDRHFIKEKVEEGVINLSYVPTEDQEADLLTEAMPKLGFEFLTCKLGRMDIYSPT